MATGTKRGKFVAWGVVLSAVVLAGIGFTTWYAYHSSQVADDALKSANKVSNDIPKLPQVKTYADCQKSPGSKTLLTYPAQCITAGGKTFIDTTKAQQQYITIKEWGVRAPYAGTLALSYTINGSDARFSAKQLDDLVAGTNVSCSGFAGVISRMGPNDLAYPDRQDTTTVAQAARTSSNFVHVGNYYYLFSHAQADCEGSLPSALGAKQTQLDNLVSQANNDVKALTASLQVIN